MRNSTASVPPTPGWLLLWSAFLAAVIPTQVWGQTVSYSGSLQYATGHYIFEDRTSSVNLSNSLSLSSGRLNAGFSLPLIFQSTPWVSYGGVGGLPTGGPQHGTVGSGGQGSGHGPGGGGGGSGHRDMFVDTGDSQSIPLPDTVSYTEVGFGDPTVNGGLLLLEESGRWPSFRVNGSVKLPMADVDRGFGTGAWDGGIGANLSKRLGMNMVFVDAMYWWMGDLDSLQIDNTISFSIAVGRVLQAGRWAAIASFAGMTPLIPDVDPPLHAGLNVMYWPGRRGGLNAGLQIGLTEASSDVAFSLGWSVQL